MARLLLPLVTVLCLPVAVAQNALQPFTPDEHTLLLYHLDEAQGTVAKDASGHGQEAVLQGAKWETGRFGGGLWFDGKDDSVFLEKPEAIRGIKQITVECWFKPEYMAGRRFLIGHDVGFHFEVDDGAAMSISLYNEGGSVPNAEGKPHQQVLTGGVSIRPERWHHLAITYDGSEVSYFLDGMLRDRKAGPKDFALGAQTRGLWLGCYVGMDYWYSGLIDEVRVSDVVRYDPAKALKPGGVIFAMPQAEQPLTAPRVVQPTKTGLATLKLLIEREGDEAQGRICLKPPGKPAVVVGEYKSAGDGAKTTELALDVSDHIVGEGQTLLGIIPGSGGYFTVRRTELIAGGKAVATWTGEARTRRTFQPPLLISLPVGKPKTTAPGRIVMMPAEADRATGSLQLEPSAEGGPPLLVGDGHVEWWLNVPAAQDYRVYLRYAAMMRRPCDIVIDGEDLNDYNMCARNTTERSTVQDALWEYQGAVRLGPGRHWLRLQDVLPDIVAVRLEPFSASPSAALRVSDGTSAPTRKVPYQAFAVPPPEALGKLTSWKPELRFGQGAGTATVTSSKVEFNAAFANTNNDDLFAGDCLRFAAALQWDLSPYGRLGFIFTGSGSGHVISLWLTDAKGDEKLLWRQRDLAKDPVEVAVPLDFEGNDVFDPRHVAAVAVELDEGNQNPTAVNRMRCTLANLVLQRRDALARGLSPAVSGADPVLTPPGSAPDTAGDRPLMSPGFRPWTKPVVPEEHPLFASTEPKPVTRQTMGYDLHFTGARGIEENGLRNFHESYDFGDVCWPHIGILPQRSDYKTDADYRQALKEMEERLQEVKRRNLYLFDIWGYVPNNELGRMWRAAPEHHEILTRVFGDRFLGYDNGEQDGRYIGSYADRGQFTDRRGGWDDFVKWDQMICDDSMNYMNATGSVNFSHYYGERGARMLGLETAQGLPSDTLLFAFLRGAGKQYGRLIYQATSIWNRYGYNMYQERKTDGPGGYGFGPHKGCSLSLHKRLFFQSYTGGDSIVGSETSQFTNDTHPDGAPELSPLGRQHLAIREWVGQHPERGVMYTPVAFMLDFYNGWNMPRHLYRADKYKIWGKLPYEKGDYLIDNVFRMVWPGYEDCSYLRNERGFICDTPYGDIFDVITNRCHPSVLQQYAAVMLMGEVEITPEVAANLRGFVEQGGDIVLDVTNARKLAAEMTGLELGEPDTANATLGPGPRQIFVEQPYTFTQTDVKTAEAPLIDVQGHAILTVNAVGKGRVIVCLADCFMTDKLEYADPTLVNMEPPYALLNGVRAVLNDYFSSFSPVTVDPPGLNVRVNCYEGDPKRLLVALTNNELFSDWQGSLRLRSGQVQSLRDQWQGKELPVKAPLKVPAGDVRIMEVRLK